MTTIATLAIFGSVVYVGCSNKCGSTTCNNGGSCNNNKCDCPTGYYGTSCQTGFTTALLGSYNCTRSNCTQPVTGVNAWQSVIATAATDGGFTLTISNFDNSNTTLTATVDSLGYINTNLANGVSGISAKGRFVSPIITLHFFTYSVASGIVGPECDMTMTKI